MELTKQYSSIEFAQDQLPNENDFINVVDDVWRYQEFFLPDNYARGSGTGRSIPALSGLQLLTAIENEYAHTAGLDWSLQYRVFGINWITLIEGTTVGAHADGDKVWFDIFFDAPVQITDEILKNRLRFGFKSRSTQDAIKDQVVEYKDGRVIIDGQAVEAKLEPDTPFPFVINNTPSLLLLNPQENTVTYSIQQGIEKVWYSNPNPLSNFSQAYGSDGETPIVINNNVSVCFRILSLSAESGIDFLGNQYRSVLEITEPSSTNTLNGSPNKYWLSKPNPSRFAVENLYFDLDNNPIIDHLLLDPITPGVYFNVYYSSEGSPGTNEGEWENKLWTPVPKTFRMTKREHHALPEPIQAKYLKIEFSHLQAQHYAPGDFAQPILYKKHPKWVLDYFLARLDSDRLNEARITGKIAIIFDALDLAYNYYLDDLTQEPNRPVEINSGFVDDVNRFFSNRGDFSDKVDPDVLEKINLSLQPYQTQGGLLKRDTMLGERTLLQADNSDSDYPTERRISLSGDSDLINTRSQAIIFENNFPVMNFYLKSRHRYRQVKADFTYDRAYFVGVREIALTREQHTKAHDNQFYIEPPSDFENVETNDFLNDDGVLVV